MKRKLKYKLIEEYIQIYKIAHLKTTKSQDAELVKLIKDNAQHLLKVYESTFLRLGMLNDTFIHMKKELELGIYTHQNILSMLIIPQKFSVRKSYDKIIAPHPSYRLKASFFELLGKIHHSK